MLDSTLYELINLFKIRFFDILIVNTVQVALIVRVKSRLLTTSIVSSIN